MSCFPMVPFYWVRSSQLYGCEFKYCLGHVRWLFCINCEIVNCRSKKKFASLNKSFLKAQFVSSIIIYHKQVELDLYCKARYKSGSSFLKAQFVYIFSHTWASLYHRNVDFKTVLAETLGFLNWLNILRLAFEMINIFVWISFCVIHMCKL